MIRARGQSYQVVVYAGMVGRKATYLRETHRNFDDAKRAHRRLEREVENGSHSRNAAATVKDLFDRWLAQQQPDLSPTTYRTWKGYIDARIVPELGHLRLRKLSGPVLDDFYVKLKRELANATVRQIHAIIRTACSSAIKWGWLGTNPAYKATTVPKAERGKGGAPPDPALMRKLLADLETSDPELGVFLRLAAITGARRGELCALRWSDLSPGALTISRSLACANGTTVEKDTKTHQIRTLALDPKTIEVLDAHREREAAKKAELGGLAADDFVFSSVTRRRDGKSEGPWHPDAVTHRYRTAAEKVGIGARLHDWRHWVPTHALAGGISVRQVADRLGHAQSSTTLDIYSHALPAGDIATAVVLAQVLDATDEAAG